MGHPGASPEVQGTTALHAEASEPSAAVGNPYAGRSYDDLAAVRKDLLNARRVHLREADRLLSETRKVRIAMDSADRDPIAVSEHAVIRWLERVRGMDMATVRAEIVAAINASPAVADFIVTTPEGFRLCMSEAGHVKTVMPPTPSPAKSHSDAATAQHGMKPNPEQAE